MIKAYLRYRRSIFCLYLCMVIIFPLVQFLCGFPMFSVSYSIGMISFLLLLCLFVDYIRYHKKMILLLEIERQLSTDSTSLPEASDKMEAQYQTIIHSLYREIQAYIDSIEHTHTEQVEYYTMWVHQIKTPISAMRLLLQRETLPEHTELLEQELFKIEQYVELALQYTKLKDLSGDLVIREYALEDIVNQSIKKYASLFIYKKLSLHLEEFHGAVTTDSKWCSFILEQLLSNAIKYTNRGGVSITYTKDTLTITDTGIGIRAEDMDRIFEKGYTGYNGRVDKKASGIGLYLAKKVADALSVKLHITSKVGEGTSVTIIFPETVNPYYQEEMILDKL